MLCACFLSVNIGLAIINTDSDDLVVTPFRWLIIKGLLVQNCTNVVANKVLLVEFVEASWLESYL